ncbi:MAG: hypothetical protein KDA90_11790 [Planctomycetaceae bacterium]|nr:hypothetical protein [Planctomycetaceae bacterium]
MRFCLLAAPLVLLFGSAHAALGDEPSPTRLVLGLSSADDLIGELEFMIAKLADKKASWEDNVFPNIEIFLEGVDPARAVRFDALFDDANGYRTEPIIPIANLSDFLNNNLDPIGISPRRDRRDRNLYELSGSVFEGWLRSLSGDDAYAVISKIRSDIPAEMPHPSDRHKSLVDAGNLAFAQLLNGAEDAEERRKSFKKFRVNFSDGIQKRTDETAEAFELRRVWAEQQMDQLEQWFVECSEVKLGLKVDQEKKVSTADVRFAALPETELFKSIEGVSAQGSRFSVIESPENSVIDLRTNWPYDSAVRARLREVYKLAKPVAEQAIRKDDVSDKVKDARVEFSNQLVAVLDESVDIGGLDLVLNVAPSGDYHNILVAVRCKGQESLTAALKQLPIAEEKWTLKENAAEVEGVAIHELVIAEDLTPAVEKFYGKSGIIYLGVGPDAFWLAGGEGAKERLQASIKKVKSADAAKPSQELVKLHIQALPLVQSMHDMSKEEGGFNLLEELRKRGLMPSQNKDTAPDGKTGEESRKEKTKQRTQQLANFDWQSTAIETLKKQDGQFDLVLRRSEAGVVTGSASSTEGILRTIGALIAKFADENLN